MNFSNYFLFLVRLEPIVIKIHEGNRECFQCIVLLKHPKGHSKHLQETREMILIFRTQTLKWLC